MSESALGSVFEISLRILLMLKELFPSKLDEQQVSALDFISVYASDFGLLDETCMDMAITDLVNIQQESIWWILL